MFALTTTSQSLEVLLGGAITTTNPTYVVTYADGTSTTSPAVTVDGSFNGSTAVSALAAPSASHQSMIVSVHVAQKDSVTQTVVVRINDGGSYREFYRASVPAGYSANYERGRGWYTKDTNGADLGVGTTGAQGSQGSQGSQGAQGTAAPTAHSGLTGLTTGDDHTQYIFNAPTSSTRNVITPTGAFKALVLKGAVDGTTTFEIQDTGGTAKLTIDENGNTVIKGTLTMDSTVITSVAAPSGGSDAVNKTYADALNPLTTKGDVGTYSTIPARLAVGATNDMLLAVASAEATGLKWKDPPIPVNLIFQSNAATAAGSSAYGIISSSSLAARFTVPTGKTFKVLAVSGCVESGATAGTYLMKLISRAGGANTTLDSISSAATSTIHYLDQVGTMASPLVSYAAGDAVQVGFENDATSPGAMGTNNRSCFVMGVLV